MAAVTPRPRGHKAVVQKERATVRSSVRLLLLFALVAVGAQAEPVSSLHESQWVQLRLFSSAGINGLQSNATYVGLGTTNLETEAPRLVALHLSGTWYTRSWFGFAADLRSDLVGAQETMGERARTSQQTVRGAASIALRLQPSLLIGFEARLGWSAGNVALLKRRIEAAPALDSRLVTGPSVGAAVTLDLQTNVTIQPYARLEYSVVELRGWTLGVGAQARIGALPVGPFELGLAITGEAQWSTLQAIDVTAQQFIWRAGIGPALVSRQLGSKPLEPGLEAPPKLVALNGSVVNATGAAVRASVTAGALSLETDERGAFSIETLPAGPITVKASAPGFSTASADLVVTPGTPVLVTLTLKTPTGPGRLTGTVKSKAGAALANAKVLVDGAAPLVTDAVGAFSLAQAGPGPVKVKIALDGYAPADEVVQVAPETTATLDVTLEPVAQRTRAKLRGIITSATGPVAKATVRVVELKLKQAVKADGRFETDVKGGKYTLVIEAPKHVSQTRIVEVADGDQAIFQIELEKAR